MSQMSVAGVTAIVWRPNIKPKNELLVYVPCCIPGHMAHWYSSILTLAWRNIPAESPHKDDLSLLNQAQVFDLDY